ncbi:unnamed protein product [marine sediment metagenome]|uniref:Uncharacterized protein n=1 Tax=marine sediment metagenome TaxID=412755 RepID=X1LEH1_9ZZZZ
MAKKKNLNRELEKFQEGVNKGLWEFAKTVNKFVKDLNKELAEFQKGIEGFTRGLNKELENFAKGVNKELEKIKDPCGQKEKTEKKEKG